MNVCKMKYLNTMFMPESKLYWQCGLYGCYKQLQLITVCYTMHCSTKQSVHSNISDANKNYIKIHVIKDVTVCCSASNSQCFVKIIMPSSGCFRNVQFADESTTFL